MAMVLKGDMGDTGTMVIPLDIMKMFQKIKKQDWLDF